MDIFEQKLNNLLKIKKQEIVQALEEKPLKIITVTDSNNGINNSYNISKEVEIQT